MSIWSYSYVLASVLIFLQFLPSPSVLPQVTPQILFSLVFVSLFTVHKEQKISYVVLDTFENPAWIIYASVVIILQRKSGLSVGQEFQIYVSLVVAYSVKWCNIFFSLQYNQGRVWSVLYNYLCPVPHWERIIPQKPLLFSIH